MGNRKKKIEREMGSFMRQYSRKKHPNWDPNDRQYDRRMEEKIKNMDPEELSEIISGDGTGITREIDDLWYTFQKISGVEFMLNDSVSIIKGKKTGSVGAVISLNSLLPEPNYLVELSTGEDVDVFESQLEAI
ncbi:MAG: hypothetical protein MI892_13785 [Desulfobacterales bacterium]|nr:hypothetical protein [Desulfobacterales bacterium]